LAPSNPHSPRSGTVPSGDEPTPAGAAKIDIQSELPEDGMRPTLSEVSHSDAFIDACADIETAEIQSETFPPPRGMMSRSAVDLVDRIESLASRMI